MRYCRAAYPSVSLPFYAVLLGCSRLCKKPHRSGREKSCDGVAHPDTLSLSSRMTRLWNDTILFAAAKSKFGLCKHKHDSHYANTIEMCSVQIRIMQTCKLAEHLFPLSCARKSGLRARCDSRALQRATRRHYSVTVRTNYTAAGTLTRALTVARFRIAYCKIVAATGGRRSE